MTNIDTIRKALEHGEKVYGNLIDIVKGARGVHDLFVEALADLSTIETDKKGMTMKSTQELIDEIQNIKWLVDESPAHIKLTEAQVRLTELIAALSTIDLDKIESEKLKLYSWVDAANFKKNEYLARAEKAEAALSTIEADAETGWLIESTEAQKSFFVIWGDMSDTRPSWWTGVDEDVATNDNPSWTQDSLEAVRFARKTDAEKIILGWGYSLKNQWVKVTEHRWG